MLFKTASIVTFVASASAVVIPNADTPLFYLVASSGSPSTNLLPLKLWGSGGYASLGTGNESIGKFYFYQGRLLAQDPAGGTFTYFPVMSSVLGPSGCTTYGSIAFLQGGSSNKCARYDGFQIQSNSENSQLGSKLVYNYVGGFHSCGSGQEVVYKVSPNDGPSDCYAIDLYTVPVVN